MINIVSDFFRCRVTNLIIDNMNITANKILQKPLVLRDAIEASQLKYSGINTIDAGGYALGMKVSYQMPSVLS